MAALDFLESVIETVLEGTVAIEQEGDPDYDSIPDVAV